MATRRSVSPDPTTDLFSHSADADESLAGPLADRLRPSSLEAFVGQETVIGPTSILRQAITNDELFSMILWGPPGSGKTTLARIIAAQTKASFVGLSGVFSAKDDLVQAVQAARDRRALHHQRTILFVDEIHRWNKAQQDALLPYVESGIVTLIGATTENPSFEVIAPLLSRCKVFVLERLREEHLSSILDHAVTDARGYANWGVTIDPKARELLTAASNGDARTLLNTLELAVKATPAENNARRITLETVAAAFQRPNLMYDKKGDEHYNIISAFIKSMRGSQPDAALYWLARMLEAGEDPLFIARRMVIFASEDVSLADDRALPLAVAAMQACDMIGMPECSITLSHVVTYLATCPKSNATYVAYGKAVADVQATLNEPVPLNLRNAPTKLMKELGYHRDYKYSHNYEGVEADQQYRPKKVDGNQYYVPKKSGTA